LNILAQVLSSYIILLWRSSSTSDNDYIDNDDHDHHHVI
jgi:hypothetical protein